jgi:hypothetical protein
MYFFKFFLFLMMKLLGYEGWESVVTLLGLFIFFLSLSGLGKRKRHPQQCMKDLLNEIEEDDEKVETEQIKNASKQKEEKEDNTPLMNNTKKSMMKPKQNRSLVSRNLKFETSPLRSYDDGDLFTAVRGIRAALLNDSPTSTIKNCPTSTIKEDLKSLCVMVSRHAKMMESLEARLSLLEEESTTSRTSHPSNHGKKYEPRSVQILRSPQQHQRMIRKGQFHSRCVDDATNTSKGATFNIAVSRSRINSAIHTASTSDLSLN